MKVILMDPIKLNPYQNNPRKNEEAVYKVAESIQQFGFRVPITIDKNNIVVTGHTRLKAALKLDLKEVPVIILEDMTEDQVKAFRLADNKTAEYAKWDLEALALELEEIQMDMSAFEFDVATVKAEKLEEDDFDIVPPKVPQTKYGEIYQLGKHKLMCGDSTIQEDIEALMDGEKADLLVTDPPYNVDYKGTAGKIINDNMESSAFQEFLAALFIAADSVLKPGGAFYIWHADSERFNFLVACNRAGWEIRQALIWYKSSLVLGRQDFQWIHEPCLYGWKSGAAHYFIDDRTFTTVFRDEPLNIDKMKVKELREVLRKLHAELRTTVMEEDKPLRNKDHPTTKPIKLLGRQIAVSSRLNELVLDICGGSGSTLITAHQLDRRCNMMELDPKYCDVIIKRYEELTGEKAVRIREGETNEVIQH